ncbi:hypothetical protein [Microbacterium aurantiacum]|uniref:hypothetical protein n=1 Tax=Microbacterium aurantiacum TaxID=162393 RepID=UPI00343318EC
MSAPVIVRIRPGVEFTPAAAASWRRAEAAWGQQIPTNSTYRDYDLQMSMWLAWQRYLAGGPKPNHSRPLHPDESMHCKGLAADTDMWSVKGFIPFMEARGWIRTAAWDPTEQHHFEYQWWRDLYYGMPAGVEREEVTMSLTPEQEALLRRTAPSIPVLVQTADKNDQRVFLFMDTGQIRQIGPTELGIYRTRARILGYPEADFARLFIHRVGGVGGYPGYRTGDNITPATVKAIADAVVAALPQAPAQIDYDALTEKVREKLQEGPLP